MNSTIDRLRKQIGTDRVVTDQSDIQPWLSDWRGLYHGAALALIEPRTTAEVAEVVRIARETGTPLVPQGGNTSMVGGATPDSSGTALILSLRRLNTIRRIDRDARMAVVEAGVILQTFHEAAEAAGLRFPLTLGARGSATIGGLISTNAGGTQVLRFGTMRGLVAGVEAVLPDGQIYDGLTALKKDNRGYDLTQLLIGAEGTLGVVTAATLRLVPAASETASAWIGVASPHRALDLLRSMEATSGAAIESFEIIPAHDLELVLEHIPGTRRPVATPSAWHVLIDYVGHDATARLTAMIEDAAGRGLIEDATIGANGAQAAAFWRIRDSISEAERAAGPTLAHDIAVAVDAMPEFIESAGATVEARFPGVTVSAFGHLGDGNVHFHVNAPKGTDAATWRSNPGAAISTLVYDLVTQAGGSISAEHGIGQMKLDAFARTGGTARLAALRAIKQGLDPHGLFNPGKLIPPLAPATGAP
ncbi:FAD-binding PCMH-type domain-containing protein [Sphingomonas antarctica]|uniref:FAD-binding oxidoreductase n=1 Tax=Sphingomonas antarctica TaxID=2040274 RepID=UPI0039EBF9F9